MKLMLPKRYLRCREDSFCIIAAPDGVPELAGYVMRIPQRLITGRGPTILVRHGNEKDANGKTCLMTTPAGPDPRQ